MSSSSSDAEGKRIVSNPKQLHHCAHVITKYIERLERLNVSWEKHSSQVEALIKELRTAEQTSVITIKKILDESEHYQSLINTFESQHKELQTSHSQNSSSVLSIKAQLNQRTQSWTDVKNKVTAKQLELTKVKGELAQATNAEHDHEAHAKALEELEIKSRKQLERLQALEQQGHLHLEEIKQKEIIEREMLENLTTDLSNRKAQVEEAKGIFTIRSEELVKQQGEYDAQCGTLKKKESDLRTEKIKLDQVQQTHNAKTTEHVEASLKLKTIQTEKEELKFKTTAQKQEHEELEKKALAIEDDLVVVTGAKRALAITYNETLTHIKEVHEKLVRVQNDVASRRQDFATANTDHTKLFKELGELRAKFASLTQAEHDHELHAAQLAEKEAKERAELDALKAVEEKEKAEVENLKAELESLNQKIQEIGGQVVTYKGQVEEKIGLVKIARDTHEVKQTKLIEHKQAHNKLKTTHIDAYSKYQAIQKKITQLELKLAGLNKDDTDTEAKLNALAALEAEERATIEKSLQSIATLEGEIAAARTELGEIYVKIEEKEKEIVQHRDTHKASIEGYKVKITEISTEISSKEGILSQLMALVKHGKEKIKQAKKAITAKKSGQSHHHIAIIEYSTSDSE